MLRDQGRAWDHLEVLLSLVYRLMRCLPGLLAVLFRSDLSKDAECWCCAMRITCCAVSSVAVCGGITPTACGSRRCPGW